jgi:hypothetical protein
MLSSLEPMRKRRREPLCEAPLGPLRQRFPTPFADSGTESNKAGVAEHLGGTQPRRPTLRRAPQLQLRCPASSRPTSVDYYLQGISGKASGNAARSRFMSSLLRRVSRRCIGVSAASGRGRRQKAEGRILVVASLPCIACNACIACIACNACNAVQCRVAGVGARMQRCNDRTVEHRLAGGGLGAFLNSGACVAKKRSGLAAARRCLS